MQAQEAPPTNAIFVVFCLRVLARMSVRAHATRLAMLSLQASLRGRRLVQEALATRKDPVADALRLFKDRASRVMGGEYTISNTTSTQ